MERLRLTVEIEREGAVYSAICPELSVGSQGGTDAEALRNLSEALGLYVETCMDDGMTLREMMNPAEG